MAPRHLSFLLSSLGFVACGGGSAAPSRLPEAPKPIEGELMVFPHADAPSLLGREVTAAGGGGARIADARAPGCEVIVRRNRAQFQVRRETKTHQLASIGAGYQKLASLEAKYGHDSQASLELDNAEVLEADLRGPCGRKVITKVFVGHGKRRVFAATASAASVSLATPVGSVGPSGQSASQDVDELAWSDDQAYAFETRDLEGATGEALSIDVSLPSIVTEGEELSVSFESGKPAWLVVYYVDADNNAEVLWPSNEEPSPSVEPGRAAILPSQREQAAGIKIRPALSKAGTGAREQLVVYAFADKRDFDLVKPASGSSSAGGLAFTEELAKKLRDVPASRWSQKVLGYRIEPKKK